jgi:hypothetical protein
MRPDVHVDVHYPMAAKEYSTLLTLLTLLTPFYINRPPLSML